MKAKHIKLNKMMYYINSVDYTIEDIFLVDKHHLEYYWDNNYCLVHVKTLCNSLLIAKIITLFKLFNFTMNKAFNIIFNKPISLKEKESWDT